MSKQVEIFVNPSRIANKQISSGFVISADFAKIAKEQKVTSSLSNEALEGIKRKAHQDMKAFFNVRKTRKVVFNGCSKMNHVHFALK